MKKLTKNYLFVLSLAVVFSLTAAPVFAQNDDISDANYYDGASGQEGMLNAFGPSDEFILQIPAAAFTERYDSVVRMIGFGGYMYATSCPLDVRAFSAPVSLPSGALITRIAIWAYDADSECNIGVYLRRYKGGYEGVTPSQEDISQVFSSGLGYSYSQVILPTPHTVNNDARYGGGGHYTLVTHHGNGCTSNLAFKAVDIWYKLQISPAPSTATFSDVPTTGPFFQEIEALAVSGITTGYPDGTYRPSEYITRAAMAAFLARALGLHWPH